MWKLSLTIICKYTKGMKIMFNDFEHKSLTNVMRAYNVLSDEESKMIFRQRINWYLTRNFQYLADMIKMATKIDKDDKQRISDFMADWHPNKEFIVWGAGMAGEYLAWHAKIINLKVLAACDNDKKFWGGHLKRVDVPIYSPDEIKKFKDKAVLITPCVAQNEIYEQLLKIGFCRENIYLPDYHFAFEWKDQYFDLSIMQPQNDEVFLDCGCLNLESSVQFMKWCAGRYKKIIAFEADKSNYDMCQAIKSDNLSNDDRICIENFALWDSKTVLKFDGGQLAASHLDEDGKSSIKTITIDDYIKEKAIDDKVTFIKMDIEGAEMKALEGAQKTISRDKPKLAISVYHSADDLVDIPLYVKKLNPGYTIFFRHYSSTVCETVMYAVDKSFV